MAGIDAKGGVASSRGTEVVVTDLEAAPGEAVEVVILVTTPFLTVSGDGEITGARALTGEETISDGRNQAYCRLFFLRSGRPSYNWSRLFIERYQEHITKTRQVWCASIDDRNSFYSIPQTIICTSLKNAKARPFRVYFSYIESPFRFARRSYRPYNSVSSVPLLSLSKKSAYGNTYVGLVGNHAHDSGDHTNVNEGDAGGSGCEAEVLVADLLHSYTIEEKLDEIHQ
jgi:hypothetical protein